MDTADGEVPISCLVTSASLHDSQAAIALASLTQRRVDNCYDLMDSVYDAKEIAAHRRASGREPIIDPNPRKKKAADCREQKAQRNARFIPADRVRYRERPPWSGPLGGSRMSSVDTISGSVGTRESCAI